MRATPVIGFIFFIALLSSCLQDPELTVDSGEHYKPDLGAVPTLVYPEDNEYTQERWLLGKKLFYDQRLSIDQSLSCGSCHKSEFAFSDNTSTSPGVYNRVGIRNSPSLANIAYHPYFTREGGVPSLEMQVLVPIQEHNEFNHNIVEIVQELAEDETYQILSMQTYERPFDAFVLTRAIATFERSLISNNSRFDQYVFYGDHEALNTLEIEGMRLFYSEKTQCSKCHSGWNFSNYLFENNGLYEQYTDPGRKRLTGLDRDLARFKVPSLRNIELTAPYMHDGSISTLEDVISHYLNGGENHMNKSPLISPLDLSSAERNALLAFLKSLTDPEFADNPLFKN